MFYEGFFDVFFGISLIVYSFVGKMYGHFAKSKLKSVQKHGSLYMRVGGIIMIAFGISELISSY